MCKLLFFGIYTCLVDLTLLCSTSLIMLRLFYEVWPNYGRCKVGLKQQRLYAQVVLVVVVENASF
jgi:hypothetical protein